MILKITNNFLHLLVPEGLLGFIIILEVGLMENKISALKRSIRRLRVVK